MLKIARKSLKVKIFVIKFKTNIIPLLHLNISHLLYAES